MEALRTLSSKDENRDYLKRRNYPRQSYALSGIDWGDAGPSTSKVRGKLTIQGAPTFVSQIPPGASASRDDLWQQTYGASQDAFLTLIDGASIQQGIDALVGGTLGQLYRDILPSVENTNIYQKVNGSQQIQFIASKSTVEDFRQSQDAGTLDEMRSLGMRIPMHAAGWGKTVMLRPTDPQPANPRKNDDEHKMDRSTWKTGPVDMRWHPGRRAWVTFNDLIVDDRSKAMGTPVFSINPDTSCGMPFLKGFLQDAWRVRRTNGENPESAIQNPDFQFLRFDGGELCTILSHKVYDPITNDVAALSDIFTAHGGTAVSCGDETTNVGGQLEIKAGAFFHVNNEAHGPICFSAAGPTANEDVGRMGFDGGEFCPIVPKELNQPCSSPRYAAHMAQLRNNSVNVLQDGVFDLEHFICDWNEDYTKCILEYLGWIAQNAGISIWMIHHLIPLFMKLFAASIQTAVAATVANAIRGLVGNIDASMQLYSNQISQCFLAAELPPCELEFVLTTPTISPSVVEVPEFEFLDGVGPPDCQIQSFAAWQQANGKFLEVDIFNPCPGTTSIFTSSCAAPGNPSNPPINPETGGDSPSIGGIDNEGNINLGGVDFGNTNNDGSGEGENGGPNGSPSSPVGPYAGGFNPPGSD